MNWRLRRFPILSSTSDLCVRLANEGEAEGLAVIAERQTSGRGSRGRTWESPPGALCLSVLLRPRDPATASGQWALLAALALHDALAPFAPGGQLSLKWPNDVLIAGRKLGGILLDAAATRGELDWLVVGFGANLGEAPEGAGSLAFAADPEAAAAGVLSALDLWCGRRAAEGWEAVRAGWLARAHPAGTALRVRSGPVDAAGAFDGLAEDGALLLRAGDRVQVFPTGDVLLGAGG